MSVSRLRALCAFATAASAACGGTRGPSPGVSGFEDVAPRAGVIARNRYGTAEKPGILESIGAGAAWIDFDRDGDLDLFLTNGSPFPDGSPSPDCVPTLYRNDGGRFADASAGSGLDLPRWWTGTAVGDFDGDGDADLYVSAFGANGLFRNQTEPDGPPRFVEVGETTGTADPRWGASASFFDGDLDGDLDLYVANYLRFDPGKGGLLCDWKGQRVYCGPRGFEGASDVYFRNEGDGRFADATAAAGFDPGVALNGLGVVAGDFDGDRDPDVYVANDRCRNLYFRNGGAGFFEETGVFLGVAYGPVGEEHGGMGTDFADADGDGDFDLFVSNFEDENNDFYRNEGAYFLEASAEARLDRPSRLLVGWGTRFCDFDLDGDEDLFVGYGHVYPQADRVPGLSYGQRNHLYRNDGGRFTEAGTAAGPGLQIVESSRGAAFGDYDGDGDTDVLVANLDDAPNLLHNSLPAGRWIGLVLRGTRSNRDGYGARVVLTAGNRRQGKESHADGSFLSASDPRVVFGLGASEGAESVSVTWPSGRIEEALDLAAERYYVWIEGLGVVRAPGRR